MMQRETVRNGGSRVGMYDTSTRAAPAEGDTAPADEVRWGPIIAGIFTVLTTLLTLSVLGLAIGLSTFNAGDPGGAFGIGAGIWGLISAIIAFGMGGYVAGATARVRGGDRGILNGAMVWMVTIPLSLYLLGSGVGSLLNVAGNAATAAGTVAGPVIGQAAEAPGAQPTVQAAGQAAQDAIEGAQSSLPAQVDQAIDTAGRTAWGTLLWLGLGAAAALGGGYAGGQSNSSRRRVAVGA